MLFLVKEMIKLPNHLMSKLHFSGEQKKINELLESIKGEETFFDFNKILPMPDSLNIEAGSRTENGLKAYRDFITVYTMDGTEKKDLLNVPKEKEELFLQMRSDIKREEWNAALPSSHSSCLISCRARRKISSFSFGIFSRSFSSVPANV